MLDKDEELDVGEELGEEWAPEGPTAQELDSLLRQYFEAPDVEQLREQILDVHAWAILEEAVRRRLARFNEPEGTLESICMEARTELSRALEAHRKQRDPFSNFAGYASTAASTAFTHYLRKKYPDWHRLKARLTTTLKQHPSPENPHFALWTSETSEVPMQRGGRRGRTWTRRLRVCGLEAWHHGKARWRPARRSLQVLRDAADVAPLSALRQLGLSALPQDNPKGKDNPEERTALLEAIFRWAESSHEEDAGQHLDPEAGPCLRLNDLVNTVAQLWRIQHPTTVASATIEDGGLGEHEPPPPPPHTEISPSLREVWQQTQDLLTADERRVFLLRFAFVHDFTRVDVRVRDIAVALGIPDAALAELWAGLPLKSDAAIVAVLEAPGAALVGLAPRLLRDDGQGDGPAKTAALLGISRDVVIRRRGKVIQRRREAHKKLEGEKARIRRLWQGMGALSLIERHAYLLSRTSIHDFASIDIFLSDVAQVLKMPTDELVKLARRLPLEDQEIAEPFNMRPAPIKNRRAAAYQKLGEKPGREKLKRLWEGIRELPLDMGERVDERRAFALGFNLRRFVAADVSRSEIARSLGMAGIPDKLWFDLPLSAAVIAQDLGAGAADVTQLQRRAHLRLQGLGERETIMSSSGQHIMAQELHAYLGATLSPTRLIEVDDHLAVCDICRARLGSQGPHIETRSLGAGAARPASRLDSLLPAEAIRALWAAVYAEPEADPDEAG